MTLKISHGREVLLEPIGWEQSHAIDQASSAELLWYFFPGDVEIRLGHMALASTVGSVPALHFVAAMVAAGETLSLNVNSNYSYGFTEVDQSIDFRRVDGEVYIGCNFSADKLTVPVGDFLRETRDFARREIQSLGRIYPALLAHPLVDDLVGRCEKGDAV